MKSKDIIVLMVVAFVSAFLSYFVSGFLFAKPDDRKVTVEVVEPISGELLRPDSKYFNSSANNPTQIIIIQPETNPNPFGN
jgi:hypothetical protein